MTLTRQLCSIHNIKIQSYHVSYLKKHFVRKSRIRRHDSMTDRKLVLVIVVGILGTAPCTEARSRWQDPDCEACRTIVEQFYKGWSVFCFRQCHIFLMTGYETIREVTISGLAANGTYESQAGKAPKIVYNQHIEDYLQVAKSLSRFQSNPESQTMNRDFAAASG